MKTKKRGLLLLLVLCIIIGGMVTGCGPQSTDTADTADAVDAVDTDTEEADADTEEETVEAKQVVILGICMADISNDYIKIMVEAYKAYLDPLVASGDVEYSIYDNRNDTATTINNIETCVTKKMDAVILLTFDKDGANDAVIAAQEAGIVFVIVNTRISADTEYVYVGSNDEEAGVFQGEMVNEDLPENAEVCIILGQMGQASMLTRQEGVHQALAARPDITILAEQPADWDRQKGMKLAEDWLSKYSTLDAIICANDASALGAIEACKTAGRLYPEGDVRVYSIDAVPEAVVAVSIGEMAGTVFQNGIAHSQESARAAIEIVRGVYDGLDIIVPYEPVRADNAQDYMDVNK